MNGRLLISAALSATLLVLPSVASAAGITVGNPSVSQTTLDTYSNFTIIDTNHPVSASGWLTTFSYYAANTNPFEFVLVDSGNVVKWVSPMITPAATGVQVYNVNVPVTAGWNLGVHFDLTGTIPFVSPGALATWTPNGNGMPIVGTALTVENGLSGRVYSWNGNGTDVSGCSVTTLVSSTATQFKHLTLTDPALSSNSSLFTLGTPGAAVIATPQGYPGAWDVAAADPKVATANWINNTADAPTNGGVGDGQNGAVDAWRLFSHPFTLPIGAVVSSAAIHFTADNSVQTYLDNTWVGSAASYTTISDAALSPTSGTHELEFVVKNDAYSDINPTGLIYRADMNYCIPTTPPDTECPAAPSIAAAYLKSSGIKSGSTGYKNVISLVAHQMSPQTNFNGFNSCSDGYAGAVKAYVDQNKTTLK